MTEEWDNQPFTECIEPVRVDRTKQIKMRRYQPEGKYPIVDQGQGLVAGWTDNEDAVIRDSLPYVVFGDHTRLLKYVYFPFALGADGTKLIKPKDNINPLYFYFHLIRLAIPSRGYSRHYRLLKEKAISLPPLPEQKNIAAVLLKIQRAIETQEKIIQSLSDLKKSTMQHLFTHGLRDKKTKMTEIGEIPESWEVVPLVQIASIERGKFTHRPRNDPDYYGGDIPFIQTGDVTQSNGRIRTYSQTLNKRGLSVSKIFPSGTILITIAANIGDTGILEFDSAFPDSIIGITPSNDVSSQYLEFYLRTQKRRMHQLAPKGTQMNINIEFLKPWPVKLPPTKEQLRIAQVLGGVVQKEEMRESKKSALEDLFRTALNKLMAGEIRVNDLDIDVSEIE